MLVVFSPVFVADTKIVFGYDFVAPLNISRKTKKEYFNSLNIKQVSDNKLFWKSLKPFF